LPSSKTVRHELVRSKVALLLHEELTLMPRSGSNKGSTTAFIVGAAARYTYVGIELAQKEAQHERDQKKNADPMHKNRGEEIEEKPRPKEGRLRIPVKVHLW
jgi:hypothetical protein